MYLSLCHHLTNVKSHKYLALKIKISIQTSYKKQVVTFNQTLVTPIKIIITIKIKIKLLLYNMAVKFVMGRQI